MTLQWYPPMVTEGISPSRNSKKEIDMGKRANRQEYIHNYARTLLGQLKEQIPVHTLMHYDRAVDMASHIYLDRAAVNAIVRKLQTEKDETLGRLACAGLGEKNHMDATDKFTTVRLHEICGNILFHRRNPKWLDMKNAGGDIVLHLAVHALCAAIADNIYADMRKVQAEVTPPDFSKVGLSA